MTDRANNGLDPILSDFVDEFAAIAGLERRKGESAQDHLLRLGWSLKREIDLLTRDVATAKRLFEETARIDAQVRILWSLLQTGCLVAPLLPLLAVPENAAGPYIVWAAIVCLAPVLMDTAFALYQRLRGNPSEPKGVQGA